MTDELRGAASKTYTTAQRPRSLDREVALSRVGGDLELLQEIAELFLSDSDRMLDEIQKAVASRDPKAIDRAAHTLKGCVSNFGAQRLYEASLVLERMGRSGDLNGIDPAFTVLETEIRTLEDDLRSLNAER